MPEELRIVVVDQGGAAPSRGPSAPGGGQFPRGPIAPGGRQFPRGPGGGQFPRVPIAPSVQPPPFVRPPPVQPSPSVPRAAASAGIVAAVTGPVGIAVAGAVAGFGVATIAIRKFAQAVESQTERLAGFSGPLAAAQAQTELRRELALLRRAQQVGPALGAAERLRSRFEDAMTDLGTEVLEILLQILEVLRPVIEFVITAMKALTDFLDRHGDSIGFALPALVGFVNPMAAAVLSILRLFQGEVDRREDEEEDPFTQQFLDLLPRDAHGQPLFWPAGQPVPQPGV